MIATLWDKTGKIKIGDLEFILDKGKKVLEERNGIFELIFDYPNGYPLADRIIEENIVKVKPNDDQELQSFRIYNTKKIISSIITVYARHESFDLANDHVEKVSLINASCEYALNTLFRNSHFSKDFRGYSDIINAQDFKVENVNVLNAIAGKEGSIIDTYGTGAEILRDGKNIHVLNKRGHDNGVTIEYGKNLTGFELNVDLTGLETRCGGFAKYRNTGALKNTLENLTLYKNQKNYDNNEKGYMFIGSIMNGEVIERGQTVPIRVYGQNYDFKLRHLDPIIGTDDVPLDTEINLVSSIDDLKIWAVWVDISSTTNWKALYIDEDVQADVKRMDWTWGRNHFILGTFKMSANKEGKYISSGSISQSPKNSPIRPEEEENDEVVVYSDWIDSPFIDNFSHPYINTQGRRDYSNKFKDGEIPTKEKLNRLCADEFKINKRDIPASNYKINFIPLSKCVGYENIEDKISLCDTVTIIDPRFNINTKAKVIKYEYDFIKERYISMELGEPRTTLGDIIGGGKPGQGPPGKDGKDGVDGSIEDFPDTLPDAPVLTASVKGFASIELSWTYENKLYYTYELYASKTKDFKPNTFDLIHEGKSSSFLFSAKPGETWYFRVCAKNTYGNRTEFSEQVTVTTRKADNFGQYFSNLAVDDLVTKMFTAEYMDAGIVKGHWIDGRNLSVTDGNGRRTLDINSFGKVVLQPSSMKVLIDDKVEFLSSDGIRNMALYGGQMCAYNSLNNKFLGTAGAIIADNYGIYGSGFLLSKHCNHFLIGRDAQWDDIYTNRAPKPNYYFDIDFDNFQIKLGLALLTGDVNLRGNSLYDAETGYIKDWYGFGWRLHEDGHQLMYANGHRIKFNVPVSFDGNQLMNPTLYTDRLYFTNGHLAFQQSPGTANVMSNGCHWDFNGMDLVNARIIGSYMGLEVANNPVARAYGEKQSVFDEIEVIEPMARSFDSIGTLDVSNVSDKSSIMLDENNADHGKLITMLIKEVKDLKAEIKRLKEGV